MVLLLFIIAFMPQGAIVGIENAAKQIFGFQFHPEVMHTETGMEMIKHFLLDISGLTPDWNMGQVVEEQLQKIVEMVGGAWIRVLCWDQLVHAAYMHGSSCASAHAAPVVVMHVPVSM